MLFESIKYDISVKLINQLKVNKDFRDDIKKFEF